MAFSDISVRENGQTILYSWFNLLRTAGIRLENILGSGLVTETQQSITDGQSATNVTGLSLNPSSIKYAKIEVVAVSTNSTYERRHKITIEAFYNSKKTAWRTQIEERGEQCDASSCTSVASGLDFTFSTNQAQVAADTMGSTPTRKIRWKIVETSDAET